MQLSVGTAAFINCRRLSIIRQIQFTWIFLLCFVYLKNIIKNSFYVPIIKFYPGYRTLHGSTFIWKTRDPKFSSLSRQGSLEISIEEYQYIGTKFKIALFYPIIFFQNVNSHLIQAFINLSFVSIITVEKICQQCRVYIWFLFSS